MHYASTLKSHLHPWEVLDPTRLYAQGFTAHGNSLIKQNEFLYVLKSELAH